MVRKPNLFHTLLYENNLENISELGEHLMQGIDIDGIDDVRDERLYHASIAAVERRLFDLLGQLYRVHGG